MEAPTTHVLSHSMWRRLIPSAALAVALGCGSGDLTTPTPEKFSLTVSVNGSGLVTSSEGGISCSDGSAGTCSASIEDGTAVTLTASPNAGFGLASWDGDCTGSGSCQVIMTLARNVTATFARPPLPVVRQPIANGVTVASNPADATLIIVPGAPNGEYVRFFGTKDANGLAAQIRGFLVYPPDRPTVYDEVRLRADGRPSDVFLRDGSRLQFLYDTGEVIMRAILSDGREATTRFSFTPTTASRLGMERSTASAPGQGKASLSVDVVEGDLLTRFTILHSSDGSAVTGARVDGTWQLLNALGFFEAAETNPGQYQATLPLQNGLAIYATEACSAYSDAVEPVCEALDELDQSGQSFVILAGSACTGLAIVPLAGVALAGVCSAAVGTITVACTVQVGCDLFKAALDAKLEINLAAPLELQVNVLEQGCAYQSNVTFDPPIDPAHPEKLVASIQTPCGPGPFGGIWSGSYTSTRSSDPIGIRIEVVQTGNSAVATITDYASNPPSVLSGVTGSITDGVWSPAYIDLADRLHTDRWSVSGVTLTGVSEVEDITFFVTASKTSTVAAVREPAPTHAIVYAGAVNFTGGRRRSAEFPFEW
jgi:hypothetical protein